jgi:hypothetical protein
MLTLRGIQPKKYICIGDSPSDYEMHEHLEKIGARSELVYVGSSEDLQDRDVEHVIFTQEYGYPLNRGTVFALS